ncbi:hypothetical protein ACFPK9_04655 [Rubritalea spongiae]|uniref:Malectin domain-containing protein n=1 Tax=Rubritalea spongiae TaxID=430797 RepID=A0ABW5E8J4_9BACT
MKRNTLITTASILLFPSMVTSADLAIAVVPISEDVELSATDTIDWVKLGRDTDASYRAKKKGANHIQAVTAGSRNVTDSSLKTFNMSWSDGAAPNTTGSNIKGSLEAKSPIEDDHTSPELSFKVTGLNGTYQLRVYTSVFQSAYKFSASLGSAPPVSHTDSSRISKFNLYTVDFTTTKANQTLIIDYVQTTDLGGSTHDNIGIAGISLTKIVPDSYSSALLEISGASVILQNSN